MNETEIPMYASSLPECKELADLESLANDIRLVVEITGKLMAGEKDTTLLRALFSGGLITYRRCFTSGVRNGLTRDDLSTLRGKAVEIHDYLYNQANRLIAHSVNPFEHTQVGALVRDQKLLGVASLSAQLILFGESELEQWHRLAKFLLEQIIQPRIETARTNAIAALQKVPVSDITKGPPLEYKPATAEAANVWRV